MRTLSIILLVFLLLVAPAQAASPLDYTRTTLEQARGDRRQQSDSQ